MFYVHSLHCCYLQMKEQDQLILAAKKRDLVTLEALLNDKYIDVNTIGSHHKIIELIDIFPHVCL